ncbi:MAG: hypothetical protein IPJ65_00620 [Archangiaceae bacterium]|nr:hypothetical protein [Archangiaceae bacterium]
MNALFLAAAALLAADDATWEFDAERAHVQVHGEAKDDLTNAALGPLNLKLDGDAFVKVSAHANTVGGVTLKVQDYNDEKSSCDLYATRKGDLLEFSDTRCSFPAFNGGARTTATCRKISGTAKRLKRGIALEASSTDCTAQVMGVSLAGRVTVKPLAEDKEKK